MRDSFWGINIVCVEFSYAEFVVVKASVKLARLEHIAHMVIEVKVRENVTSLLLGQIQFSVELPDLNLEHTNF